MNCLSCGSNDTAYQGVENDFCLPPIDLWKCQACNLTFDTDHIPKEEREELEYRIDDLKEI